MSEPQIEKILGLHIGEHLFGVRISRVSDIMLRAGETPVPWAGEKIAGVMNLRGHVVTVINLCASLGMKNTPETRMNIVVEYNDEFYGLLCDAVSDILDLNMNDMAPVPLVLEERWQGLAEGIFSMPGQLMILLDTHKLVEAAQKYELSQEHDVSP